MSNPPGYWKGGGWKKDILPGLTLGVILIPQSMAYGLLAGVPPVYGLYAALVPLVVYTLLASTPHVSVGPTALASLLCFGGVSPLAIPGSPEFLAYAILLAMLAGLLQLLFGLLRMGGIVNLLSRPVLSGFVSAAAVLIAASQFGALTGIEGWFASGPELATLGLGVASLLALLAGSRWFSGGVVMLGVILGATVIVGSFGLDAWGIEVVGDIPGGLPVFLVPEIDRPAVLALLPTAAVIALLSFVETLSIGKAFSGKYDYYRVRPNRELMALGISKLSGAFSGAIPTSGSFSRSAIVEGAGARGVLPGLLAATLLLAALLFLTPIFYYLPIPTLAAVIIFSVRNLFDGREMRRLYRLAPKEFATLALTFVFTLVAGLQWGIAGGVLLSLIFVLRRAARPHLAELGRIPGTNAFRNVDRFAEAEIDPEILIARFDAELYYHNAEFFYDSLRELVDRRGGRLRLVILDAHTINDLDTSGLHYLRRLHNELRGEGVGLCLTGALGPVRDLLFREGLMHQMGTDAHFLSIQRALDAHGENRPPGDPDGPALQHQ